MLWSFLCLSQVRTWTSNVICYGLFCVCHKSGPEPLTSYVKIFFVSVTNQDLNLLSLRLFVLLIDYVRLSPRSFMLFYRPFLHVHRPRRERKEKYERKHFSHVDYVFIKLGLESVICNLKQCCTCPSIYGFWLPLW